jgi:hypothetical protein
MFDSEELKNHLSTSQTVRTESAVFAEWNLNVASNIKKIGNYRYRHDDSTSKYQKLPSTFDPVDSGMYYTNATDADVVIDGGYDNDNLPFSLKSKNDKLKMLYSLEDCFKQFRPRSGINKAAVFDGLRYLHNPNPNMAKRPRYYMADKDDTFKYWTSFRRESQYKYTYTSGAVAYGLAPTFIDDDAKKTVKSGVIQPAEEFGLASNTRGTRNIIRDAAPFIVYNKDLPANKIIIKMQTHVGSFDYGTFTNGTTSFSDPLYGLTKQATPTEWDIEVLKNNNWTKVLSFNSSSKRESGQPIIPADGYVELSYGLKIPKRYKDDFVYAETLTDRRYLPGKSITGYAYLVKSSETELGQFYIWWNDKYEVFTPEYTWKLEEDLVNRLTNFCTDLTNPDKFMSNDNVYKYREFEYISGVRLSAKTMNVGGSTLDLIEISPRLSVNLSDKVLNYSINRSASDLGQSGLPVGQLLASSGSLELFDYDDAFNENNSNSLVRYLITKNLQLKFYEIIVDVDGYDYYVPIKTMYTEGFFKLNHSTKTCSITLRDLFFYFESIKAPQTLLTNVSLSSAISMLLDSIGFSNYIFKRVPNETELVIPFFFIPPDKNVAQILEDLAVSSQTAMFFDEYNNFCMMSKNYIMPSTTSRETDFTLYGSPDSGKLSNIIEVASEDQSVYNDGVINYTSRHIQKSVGTIKQASLIDNEQSWIYKPVLLWEVSGTENTKSKNESAANQSSYVLGAIPLNSDLTEEVPYVSNNRIVNNTIDLGEGSFWITRYSGYFYANAEIIRYDAVQFNVSGFGNVWISSADEYQDYFSKLPFNGKIYPTGLLRIYTEPNYETVGGITRLKNGDVAKHGRCQFGTGIKNSLGVMVPVKHYAGANAYWSNVDNLRGCLMKSDYLFTQSPAEYTAVVGAAGISNTVAKKTGVSTIIKNFLSSNYIDEASIRSMKSTQSGTIQSSALVMTGPTFTTEIKPNDFISYIHKPLNDRYKHFGTRMRIVGKIENNLNRGQTASGGSTYYVVPGSTPDKDISIVGGSGGLAVMLNPETNNGYYFEIIALGTTNINSLSNNNVSNVIFYKIMKDSQTGEAVPVKLYEGLSDIIVDDGKFTGQYRMVGEDKPTVYDLSVEYEDIGNFRRFYLYINNSIVATVDDKNPLPAYNSMALFTRGSSKCMFENIYALATNYTKNTSVNLGLPTSEIFSNAEIDTSGSFKKYAMSGVIQGSYLSGISPSEPPSYNMYFEEFGTIMREASLFNVKYDKAYPALYAKLSPTFNQLKGYTVSGFRAGSYGAEFMIFNATDTALSLDETTGNYLRIQGVTFTQESQNKLTMDEYFAKTSDFSDPEFITETTVTSPYIAQLAYQDIKTSRLTYGKKDFSLDLPYVQSRDEAKNLMTWLASKITKPRKSIGLKVFSIPTIQLGDIVNIKFLENDIDKLSSSSKRYVVYNISYMRKPDGPDMSIYLSEVS